MEDTIKEKLLNKAISPISIESTKKILKQMKKCVCKIYINGNIGTGFFTKIPYNNKLLKVLITNNHIIHQDIINKGSTINLTLKNDKIKKQIQLNNNRKYYTNEFLDTTIIQIIEDDDINYYLELDDEIINNTKFNFNEIFNNCKNIYTNSSIYILNYIKGENIVVSYGILIDINEEGIIHKCDTDFGSSGAPILSLKNNKLIGIHYGASKKHDYNKGSLLIYSIIEFNKFYLMQDVYNNNIRETQNFVEKRILEEYNYISNCPLELPINVSIPDKNNIFIWRVSFIGPENTPYGGGLFFLRIIFPKDYPNHGPAINFLTPIYHPNVDIRDDSNNLGAVTPDILNAWRCGSTFPPKIKNVEEYRIRFILSTLYLIFFTCGTESPYDEEMLSEYKNNPELFNKKAYYFTRKYANPINSFYGPWDFSDKNFGTYDKFIDVIFDDGLDRIIISCQYNETVEKLLSLYYQKKEIKDLNKDILLFHHNKRMIDYYDKRKLKEANIHHGSIISVIDKTDIIFA